MRARGIRVVSALSVAAVAVLVPISAHSARDGRTATSQGAAAKEARSEVAAGRGFKLIGHDPLYSRGMNAAPAVHGDYAYIGSRTDGQPHHSHPGILVVDISKPSKPKVVHEIGPPDAALVGETSRELRVWPQQDLLIVLNFPCSEAIHACVGSEAAGHRVTFFDISGRRAAKPKLVATYHPSEMPHEFFLWVDPNRPRRRALLFQTTPTTSKTSPNLIVTDISKARRGKFIETSWVAKFDAGTFENGEEEDRRLHSLGVSNDGRRAFLAFLGSGFLVLDTSEVAAGKSDPTIKLVTPPKNRVSCPTPALTAP